MGSSGSVAKIGESEEEGFGWLGEVLAKGNHQRGDLRWTYRSKSAGYTCFGAGRPGSDKSTREKFA